ncbi:MAG: dienelactone hydrolase family protein [Planctomycetota bacterium]
MAANTVGAFGAYIAALCGDRPQRLSFRQPRFKSLAAWQKLARARAVECLAEPPAEKPPRVKVLARYQIDGLDIEELRWQLSAGPATDALFLKPAGATGKLPGVVGLHDHGGNKYFGCAKITRRRGVQHPLMIDHQQRYYSGRAWANELAHRGYAVLVHDTFPFASRRVHTADVLEPVRANAAAAEPVSDADIEAYNHWAGSHEHIWAKTLSAAGTTWPAMVLREDRVAVDLLCARPEVDAQRIGCMGLSGGGCRTVFLGGMDKRIRAAVCVGFMTTNRDLALQKCWTHTWMAFPPLLGADLDFPEILGLRVPLPTMVLNCNEDGLYTLPEMKRADRILREVYKKAGAKENYRCNFYPGGHKFDRPMQEDAFAWLDRSLGKKS